MMVTIEQIKRGVHHYAEDELITKSQGLTKLGMYMLLPSVDNIIQEYANRLHGSVIVQDFMDDNGNVDIDIVTERAIMAMEHMHYIEVAGFRFNESDVRKLRDIIVSI